MRNEMYAYLARRDKQGVKFLGSFLYDSKVYPTKLEEGDMKSLNMSPQLSSELLIQLRDNRMEYELFLETAENFEQIKSSLRARGYSKIPNHQFSSSIRPGNINGNFLVTKESTMMRRGSTN